MSSSDFHLELLDSPEFIFLFRSQIQNERGSLTYVGSGNSMAPCLVAGDEVRIEEISARVRPGWIVVFPWRGRVLTHRVIWVSGCHFWARGDAAEHSEGPVAIGAALARVTGVRKEGAWRDTTGLAGNTTGLAYNLVMGQARMLSRKFPNYRSWYEKYNFYFAPLRMARSLSTKVLFGEVSLKVETSVPRVVGAACTAVQRYSRVDVDEMERAARRGALKLLVADTSKGGRAGQALLSRIETLDDIPTGYFYARSVRASLRGLGFGRDLLQMAENVCRRDGIVRLLRMVEPSNFRSLGHRYSGYHLLSDGDCARIGVERKLGHLVLEKLL